MIKCKNCGEEIETPKRTLFEKIRAWVELITFVSALGVLGVMLYNSFQTKDSIELTRESVKKIDTGFDLTRQQIDLQAQQNELMREELNLTRTSVEVQRSQEEVSRKESIERNRPRIEIKPPEVIFSDSGLLIYTTLKNTGFSDAEDVRLFGKRGFPIKGRYDVVSYSGDSAETTKITPENFSLTPGILLMLPTDSIKFDQRPGKITKTMETMIEDFVPKPYYGDFYSIVNITYSWSMYKKKYEDSNIYYHIYHQKDSTFSTRLIDVRMAPLMK